MVETDNKPTRLRLSSICLTSLFPASPPWSWGIKKRFSSISLSVLLSVSPSLHIPPWWLDGFSSYSVVAQVQWATDACKIKFGSVPNLSNYGYFFIRFECLLWYLREEWGDFVHFWYSYQVPCVAHACKIPFSSVPNLTNYGHF